MLVGCVVERFRVHVYRRRRIPGLICRELEDEKSLAQYVVGEMERSYSHFLRVQWRSSMAHV